MRTRLKQACFFALLFSLMLFFVFCLALNFWPHQPLQERIENLVVFGDSLSDSMALSSEENTELLGNNYWAHVAGSSSHKGAPITSRHSATHQRYTWLNYFVLENLKHHPLFIRRNHQQGIKNNQNISYAVASATTIDGYTNDLNGVPMRRVSINDCAPHFVKKNDRFSCVPGLLKQVKTYLSDIHHHPSQHSLFILWAGGNDLYDNIVRVLQRSKGLPLYHPVRNIDLAVNTLIQHGVPPKHIYVLNLPDFSMVPAVVNLVEHGLSNKTAQRLSLLTISQVSKLYNFFLKASLLISTKGQFKPYQVFPVSDLFLTIYTKHQKAHAQQQKQQSYSADSSCTEKNHHHFCADFIFYNPKHPTTEVHQLLARNITDYLHFTPGQEHQIK